MTACIVNNCILSQAHRQKESQMFYHRSAWMDADLTDFDTYPPSTWVSSPATLEAMGASKCAPAGNQTRAQRWQRWILPLNHWH